MIIGTFIAILCLLGMSAFFSGSETALTAASRTRMHQLERDGDKRAAKVTTLISDREKLIGAILLGNNLVNILASALATTLFASLLPGAAGVAVATAVMTILVLIFAEVLPKTYAITRADRMAMSVAKPISWLVAGAAWIVTVIQTIVNFTLRMIGASAPDADFTAEEEIRGAIDFHHFEGGVDEADRHRLVGALDLKDMTVEEVMIHRKNITMLDGTLPSGEIIRQALKSPHTRIPLYQADDDEIIGILHVKDLLRAVVQHKGNIDGLNLTELLREPWFVPETTPLQDQLDLFLKERNHFALVIDEYGELQGLLTLEDILEEIVGDIRDEHDVPVQGVRPQSDGSVITEGWVTIRDLNRATGWQLPDEEAVTVAGLVIHEAQTIPEPGQRFAFHGHRFDIIRKTRNQITGLRVAPMPDEPEDD
ncbi:MAG TPA: HlyC/CorC family transporter [Henriciella marina]|uniref:HlyC/CorC family transporter n=1 Tax=Henriciella sp. TaxID=1968823 RepID=UPI00181907F0|nr:HlyC/CorC family transporter [Henriciella sp.]HIG22435.1 HlyC/CorC family transporter [Henriciella sp.]HIK65802.1 HlyC/CorC family transporter [Henriciella marina]